MTPVVSVVMPAKDEAGNIANVVDAITAALDGVAHEIVVVDDASTDGTQAVLRDLVHRVPQLRVMVHSRSCGQSAAIRTGILAAGGTYIATLDADGQNPPANLPSLLAPLLGQAGRGRIGLVQGQRMDRRDTLSKRWASRAANRIRGALLQDGVNDSGCGLKAFPRDVYVALPFFDHIHRFMPAMVRREGWQVLVVPVTHAERRSGRSKYNNLQRALVGAIDLLGAAWLIRRRRLPEAHALSAVTMPPERSGARPPEAAAPPSLAFSETVRWNAPTSRRTRRC